MVSVHSAPASGHVTAGARAAARVGGAEAHTLVRRARRGLVHEIRAGRRSGAVLQTARDHGPSVFGVGLPGTASWAGSRRPGCPARSRDLGSRHDTLAAKASDIRPS